MWGSNNDTLHSGQLCFWNFHITFFMVQQLPQTPPPVGQGLLICETSRSHTGIPHSVPLLWTSDQPDVETSTWQQTTLTSDRHLWAQQDSNPQSHKQAAADSGPRRRGHWDQLLHHLEFQKKIQKLHTMFRILNLFPPSDWQTENSLA